MIVFSFKQSTEMNKKAPLVFKGLWARPSFFNLWKKSSSQRVLWKWVLIFNKCFISTEKKYGFWLENERKHWASRWPNFYNFKYVSLLKLRETQCIIQNSAEILLLSAKSWLIKIQLSSCTQCKFSTRRHLYVHFKDLQLLLNDA